MHFTVDGIGKELGIAGIGGGRTGRKDG